MRDPPRPNCGRTRHPSRRGSSLSARTRTPPVPGRSTNFVHPSKVSGAPGAGTPASAIASTRTRGGSTSLTSTTAVTPTERGDGAEPRSQLAVGGCASIPAPRRRRALCARCYRLLCGPNPRSSCARALRLPSSAPGRLPGTFSTLSVRYPGASVGGSTPLATSQMSARGPADQDLLRRRRVASPRR